LLREHERPRGTSVLSNTVLLKPPVEVTVTVEAPAVPDKAATWAGLAAIEKSGVVACDG
jgi:hypothetical protein